MDTQDRVETPVGEEVHVEAAKTPAAERPARLPAMQYPAKAEMSEAGHAPSAHSDSGIWTGQSSAGTLNGGSYYLTADVTGDVVIPSGVIVTLCLNGQTLTGTGSGSVITVESGATLILCDCGGTGTVTGGKANNGGGVFVAGSFTMNSGTIKGNEAGVRGGGVYVAEGGAFQMSGGSVEQNYARRSAVNYTGSFGGGVYVNGGTFYMSGGSITNNMANNGGGIYLLQGSSFSVSGSPVVANNMNKITSSQSVCNVRLLPGQTIEIVDAMEPAASVGVYMQTPGVFTSGNNVDNTLYAANFISDSASRSACAVGDQLSLGAQVTYIKPDGFAGTAPVDSTVYSVGDTVTLSTEKPFNKEGIRQTGWTDSNKDAVAKTEIVITKNTNLYPVFVRSFSATAEPAVIEVTYDTTRTIDLNDYLEPSTGEKRFTFQAAAPLPDAMTLSGSQLRVAAGAAVGTYDITINVTDNSAAFLMSLTPDPAENTAQLALTIKVLKKVPAAGDLTYTPPANLYYDGNPKTASVTSKLNMGGVTTKYYNSLGSEVAAAIEPGVYTVKGDVAGNDNYDAKLVDNESWTFTVVAREAAPQLVLPAIDPVVYKPMLRLGNAINAAKAFGEGWSWGAATSTLLEAKGSPYTFTLTYRVPSDSPYDWSGVEGSGGEIAPAAITRQVTVIVNKAPATDTLPEAPFTATAGQKLADIQGQLPEGWAWVDGTTAVGAAGTRTFLANYDPTGTEQEGNYNAAENVPLTVTVTAASVSASLNALKDPQTVKLNITGSLEGAKLIAVRHTADGAMAVLRWGGTLNGDEVTFTGGGLALDQGWKLLFLDTTTFAPLCVPVELVTE